MNYKSSDSAQKFRGHTSCNPSVPATDNTLTTSSFLSPLYFSLLNPSHIRFNCSTFIVTIALPCVVKSPVFASANNLRLLRCPTGLSKFCETWVRNSSGFGGGREVSSRFRFRDLGFLEAFSRFTIWIPLRPCLLTFDTVSTRCHAHKIGFDKGFELTLILSLSYRWEVSAPEMGVIETIDWHLIPSSFTILKQP